MKNKLLASILLFPICIMISILIVNITLKFNSISFKDLTLSNILKNANFQKGFENWKHDKGVVLTNVDNRINVHTVGVKKKQRRLYQDINVVSGCVYCLKFELSGKQNGAFAIYRDNNTGKEDYFWCNGSEYSKKYSWNIKPKRTGKNSIYLSTNEEGDYFFTNIQLLSDQSIDKCKFSVLAAAILIFAIILEILIFSLCWKMSFLIIILAFLIIPILKISSETKSETENRNLATYKPLIHNGKINTSYGKDLNELLNDRFFGRKFMLAEYRDFQFFIDRRYETKGALQGKDGWLFQKFNPNLFLSLEKDDIVIINNISNIVEKYNQLGIKSYFASIPEKNIVYEEFNYFKGIKEELSEMLSKREEFVFLFLLDDLKKEKNNGYLYFKDDHHWTERGAYVYCKAFINFVKKDFPDINDLNLENYNISKVKNTYTTSISHPTFHERKNFIGSLRKLLNIDNYSINYVSYYESFRHKKFAIPKTDFGGKSPCCSVYKNNDINNGIKIVIVGDSNISFMIPFLTSTFAECMFIQTNAEGNYQWKMKRYDRMIKEFEPDILFLITRSSNIKKWDNFSD